MTERRFGYLHRVFGNAVWDHILPHLNLTLIGGENLVELDSLIEGQNRVIMATNHESHLDFLIYARLLQENINSPHALAFFASMKFFDGRMNPLIAGIAHYLAYAHDYLLLPTIQDGDERYTPNDQARQNADTSNKVRSLLKQGSAIVGLAPEGGRSENGVVRQAQPGSGLLLRRSDYFIPMSVEGTTRILPKSGPPHPFAQANITIGVPIEAQTLIAQSHESGIKLHDLMMLEILKYLPPEKWGAYSQYLASAPDSSLV